MSHAQLAQREQYRADCSGSGATHRPTFHDTYLKPPSARDRRAQWPRLLDCILIIVPHGDARYSDKPDADEFVVIDLATREKAFCEWPPGAPPETLHALIEGYFGVAAERIAERVWCV